MSKTIKILIQEDRIQFEGSDSSFSFIVNNESVSIKFNKCLLEGEVIEIPNNSIIKGLKTYEFNQHTKLFIHYFTSNGIPTIIGEVRCIRDKTLNISNACVQLTEEKTLNSYDASNIQNYDIFTEFVRKCSGL